jgi:esterase/lipase superfamily enzyme
MVLQMPTAQNYYLISNRAYDPETGQFSTDVATNGTLTFLSAPAASPTTFTVVAYSDWLAAVHADVRRCAPELLLPPFGPPVFLPTWVTLFIHGYGVPFDAAVQVFPTYFANLTSATGGGYTGVLIGFDWPSDDLEDKWHQAAAFQAAKTKARTTAQLSFPTQAPTDGLPRLLQVLQQIQASAPVPVQLSAICHSMGNYVMFEGATAFAPVAPLFEQIVCAAAMLEYNGFNCSSSTTYCADIVAAAKRVTIYRSTHDDVLPAAELPGYDGYHELGIYGPQYDGTLLAGTIGVDCSLVVDKANATTYESGQSKILIHTSYFFIPQVLRDIVQTVTAVPATDLGDRTPVAGSDGAGYTMNALTSAT